jgi:hypothetical protein
MIEFRGKIFYWRGPSPYHFVAVPPDESGQLKALARYVTYGWGMIPAVVRLGATEWETALFPKNGGYLVPIKDWVRNAERVGEGDMVTLRLEVVAKG